MCSIIKQEWFATCNFQNYIHSFLCQVLDEAKRNKTIRSFIHVKLEYYSSNNSNDSKGHKKMTKSLTYRMIQKYPFIPQSILQLLATIQ